MKIRYISVLLLLLAVGPINLFASSTEIPPKTPAGPLTQGKIQALIVLGDVSIIDSTGIKSALKKGQTFTEGTTIVAGPSSGTTLVFSNGATIRVKENNQLKVVKFLQAPFDETKEGTFLRLTRDPSHSEVELYLDNGNVQGEVKELNKLANSTFIIMTPSGLVGPVGITGTIFSVSVQRDASGNVTGMTSNVIGSATPSNSPANAAVGNEGPLKISLTTNANGQVTSANVTGAGANTPQAQAALKDLFDAINKMRAQQNLAPVTMPSVSQPATAP